MPRRPDPTNLRIAQFSGRASRVRDQIRRAERLTPETLMASREQLPDLWAAVDDLLELVDWD